ncbi:long-chain-fatty-acid--CoA ligase [Sphingomonas sp. RHCKR47]|uniref:long-chain-fatty-acid--CoA ligase n=1 Tax=Sphingomonas citricola TaxID=2862498 RepID=UPI001CA490E4|nr:long-chain-fatty-acid--CoA ligase [Sphingomonas citricola]MBW6523957.1 long-chain-fatty-acid--CoA ligase [Sphingomonas citricola]
MTQPLFGLMQDVPLTVDRFLDHAATWHGAREIVSREGDGSLTRLDYAWLHRTAKRVSNALARAGIGQGDRVATMGWNSARHLAAWYGATNMGAVLHTLNPRLFAEQIAYIADHAGDRILLADPACAPLIGPLLAAAPRIEQVVFLCAAAELPATDYPAVAFDDWIADEPTEYRWGGFDERLACGLCYTSGTTGNPKGVLYSHRSNYLHTMMTLQADALALTTRDTVLLIVPMYHANAWGVVYSAPAVGAKLVLPGARMDGESIYRLIEDEGVTFSAAVPTVWQGLLHYLRQSGARFSTLKRVVIGGSAPPEALIRAFQDEYGVDVIQGWGMTETSPLATLSTPSPEVLEQSYDEQVRRKGMQGRLVCGLEFKLTDDEGNRLPHDGRTAGRLKIKGPTITSGYFGGEGGNVLDAEGFFDTGDVSTIDAAGYMQITDRAKDIVKSGGEWISSIEIENIAVGHPEVALAAVIGVAHPKWDERPILLVQRHAEATCGRTELLAFLDGKIARWWMPDDVVVVDEIPLGATGKIDKKLLRQRMAGYVLPELASR